MFNALKNKFASFKKKRLMEKKGFTGTRKRKKQDETFGVVANKSKSLWGLILLLLFASTLFILMNPVGNKDLQTLVEKQIVPKTIYSEIDFEYEDKVQTNKNKEFALKNIPLFYKVDKEISLQTIDKFNKLFIEVDKRKKQDSYLTDSSEISHIVSNLNPQFLDTIYVFSKNKEKKDAFFKALKQGIYNGIISDATKQTPKFKEKEIVITDIKNRKNIKPKQLKTINTKKSLTNVITEEIKSKYVSDKMKNIKPALQEVLLNILQPNMIKDQIQFDKVVAESNKNIKKCLVNIKKQEILVKKSAIVTKEDIEKLKNHNKQLSAQIANINKLKNLKENGIICLFLLILTGIYIQHIHPEVLKNNKSMWMIGSITICSLFINYGVLILFNKIGIDFELSPVLANQVIPIALCAILLSVLIGLRVAIYAGLYISIVVAILLDKSFDVLLLGLFVSCIAGFFVRYSTNYKAFFMRALATTLITSVVINYAFNHNLEPQFLLNILYLTIFSSVMTAILALVLLFLFEYLFQASTNMSLLALCDYNHPLLKRLQIEAPGTYHHSLMVSNLVEPAAVAIGANPIQVRVAALFHDIGKLSKPEYFTENNLYSQAKHNALHPRMSSMIISNHVKEGIDMAIKYKLNKIIRDAIEQHHGKDLVSFFYHQAVKESSNSAVGEQDFRYTGPLPQSKEMAILSLADICEAAARSIEKPTHTKIENLVWELIRKRFSEGQLSNSELTLADVVKVKNSFVKTLTNVHHTRIAYPKEEEKEDENDLFVAAKKNADSKEKIIESSTEKSK